MDYNGWVWFNNDGYFGEKQATVYTKHRSSKKQHNMDQYGA